MHRLVDKSQLEAFEKDPEIRRILPELIRRLIQTSAGKEGYRNLRIPDGENYDVTGLDGEVELIDVCGDIPAGKTVIEIGATSDKKTFIAKANKEYDRVRRRLGPEASNYTFVMVGRVPWDGIVVKKEKKKVVSQRKWVALKKSEKNIPDFKYIVVIDQDKLIKWINEDIDTSLWFLQALGHASRANTLGICSLDRRVERYLDRFKIHFNPDILTVEQAELDKLVTSMQAPSAVETVFGNSEVEVSAAVSHYLTKCAELSDWPKIVIESLAGVELLENISTHHIIILEGEATKYVNRLKRYHSCIISKALLSEPSQAPSIMLRRHSVDGFAKNLSQGPSTGEHATAEPKLITRAVGRTMTALERNYGNPDACKAPWANPDQKEYEILKTLALVGGWNTGTVWVQSTKSYRDHFKDKELLCELCGVDDYKTIDKIVKRFSRDEDMQYGAADPMFATGPKVVSLNAPIDAFYRFSYRFDKDDYEKLKKTLATVLETRTVNDRPKDEFYDPAKETGYSEDLTGGLILTFVLLGLFGDQDSLNLTIDGSRCIDWCNEVYKTTLPQLYDHPELANSISKWLPLLAEGLPHAFLDSLERLLEGHSDTVQEIFRSREEQYGFGKYHLGAPILWSLERLGWIEEHASRVCDILLRLHLTAGGKDYNQPMDSLEKILNLGVPMTMASTDNRIAIIKKLANSHKQDVLELFSDLLDPRGGSVIVPGKPIFTKVEERAITYGEIYEVRDCMVDLSINLAAGSPNELEKLVDAVPLMVPAKFDEFIAHIEALDASRQNTLGLCETIRKFAARHAQFPDAGWSVDEKRINALRQVRTEVRPEGIEKHLWMFTGSWVELYDTRRIDTYEILDQMRLDVMPEILEKNASEILKFVNDAEGPHTVGYSIGKHLSDTNKTFDFISKNVDAIEPDKRDDFLRGLSNGTSEVDTDALIGKLSSGTKKYKKNIRRVIGEGLIQKLELIQAMLSEEADEEITKGFWTNFNVYRLFHIDIPEGTIQALIDVGRIHDLAVLASKKSDKLPDDILENIARSFLPSLSDAISNGQSRDQLAMHSFWDLLDIVEKREILTLEERALIEFPVSKLFRFNGPDGTPALHRLMSQNPAEFVSVLKMVYKPRVDEKSTELKQHEPELPEHMSEAAYSALSSMKILPGQMDNTFIDHDFLSAWCNEVIMLAKKSYREQIAWHSIGQLLANSPADPNDHLWPHKSVRKFVEDNNNDRFLEGLRIAQFNNRGVITGSSEVYYSNSAENF